jgi:deazaflavin-dependent oxidoreductase (nitroreductase family)
VVQRVNQRFAASPIGARIFSRITRPFDALVDRVTKGRSSASQLLAGLPVVKVTTTGRRSGQPRTAPLIAVPFGDDLALLGTNFGGASTPAWVHNLQADPAAQLEYRDRRVDVTARLATDDEFDQIFESARQYYVGYEKYRERVTGRDIVVFVLIER